MSRDPKRIDELMGVLRNFWKSYPDLRFTQMICFFFPDINDLYYLEDDQVIDHIKKKIKEMK
mgnify:CR=1 FL=1